MAKYTFESDYFGISENSFHLLRNRFSYKTYSNREVVGVILEEGRLINNWLVIFVIGVLLTVLSIFYVLRMYQMLQANELSHIYIEQIVAPIMVCLIGGYCIYSSMKKGLTLRVGFVDGKKKRFPLDKVKKRGQLDALKQAIKMSEGLANKTTLNA